MTGLGVASIGPLHDLTPATALALVASAALEQLASRAAIGMRSPCQVKRSLLKRAGVLG